MERKNGISICCLQSHPSISCSEEACGSIILFLLGPKPLHVTNLSCIVHSYPEPRVRGARGDVCVRSSWSSETGRNKYVEQGKEPFICALNKRRWHRAETCKAAAVCIGAFPQPSAESAGRGHAQPFFEATRPVTVKDAQLRAGKGPSSLLVQSSGPGIWASRHLTSFSKIVVLAAWLLQWNLFSLAAVNLSFILSLLLMLRGPECPVSSEGVCAFCRKKEQLMLIPNDQLSQARTMSSFRIRNAWEHNGCYHNLNDESLQCFSFWRVHCSLIDSQPLRVRRVPANPKPDVVIRKWRADFKALTISLSVSITGKVEMDDTCSRFIYTTMAGEIIRKQGLDP